MNGYCFHADGIHEKGVKTPTEKYIYTEPRKKLRILLRYLPTLF